MNHFDRTYFGSAPFSIIDGDRGKNYPKQGEFSENGFCLFLNATNVTRNGFDFTQCPFKSQSYYSPPPLLFIFPL
jgi:type I restriction enzyme S subunit